MKGVKWNRVKATNQEVALAKSLEKIMTESIGVERETKEVVKEILDIFSQTSLEIEDNRAIIAETIARELNEAPNKLERCTAEVHEMRGRN